VQATKAARLAARPAFLHSHFKQFKMRDNTMDQHVMVANLAPALLSTMTTYLATRFPNNFLPGLSITAKALQIIWERHPLALRVKELFETVETFLEIESVVARIKARAKKDPAELGIDSLYDLACGHGLLGVLLATRFPDTTVVCVDLVKRPGFEQYTAAFEDAGADLKMLEFVEGDMKDTVVGEKSFVTCIHACNEANVIALEKARAGEEALFESTRRRTNASRIVKTTATGKLQRCTAGERTRVAANPPNDAT